LESEVASNSSSPETAETREPAIDWATAWAQGTLGTLGRFQLRERLGDGGFGQVFLAFDPRLDRDVAVKVLKQPHPSERVMERFFREARAVARLDHPNVVAVHDAGFDSGRCWVAYQLVSGRPLWWYRDHHRMDAATAARIIRDLADAVDHAHRMGVVHRDIKPANVIIDDRGRPRLIDFGLARRSDLESDLTREGAVVGTPAYMSPEQALGLSRQVDERSDVYSLGVIFFELLCGRRLRGLSTERLQGSLRPPAGSRPDTSAISARSIDRSIPSDLDRICTKAMAQQPSERYPTARALAEELDQWLKQVEMSRSRHTSPLAFVALGMAASMVLVISIWTISFSGMTRTGLRAGADQTQPPGPASRQAVAASPRTDRVPSPLSAASSPTKERRSPPRSGVQLIANRETRLYHRASCTAVQSMAERNRLPLDHPAQAEAEGFRPCEKCRPPVSEPARSQPVRQAETHP
jgi:serine/threonine protein kinase